VALIYKKAFAFKQISRMQFKSFEYMDMVSNVSNPVRIIVVYRYPDILPKDTLPKDTLPN
jgi:hypothetical protein